MIQITRINLDRLTPAERAAHSAVSAPGFGRHPLDVAVEAFANSALKRLVELHAAGKPLAEFLAKAPEAIR